MESIDDLRIKRSKLEKDIETLKQQNDKAPSLETVLNIMNLESKLRGIDEKIRVIQVQKQQRDEDNIYRILGVNYDNYTYSTLDSGMIQRVPKSLTQLQVEYMSLIRKLDDKLDKSEVDEEQYDVIYDSLTSLYNHYKDKLASGNIQPSSTSSENVYQEPQQYYQPEIVDKIDEYEELLRQKYGYYDSSEQERERIDRLIQQEFHKNEEASERIENHNRRLM